MALTLLFIYSSRFQNRKCPLSEQAGSEVKRPSGQGLGPESQPQTCRSATAGNVGT